MKMKGFGRKVEDSGTEVLAQYPPVVELGAAALEFTPTPQESEVAGHSVV